MTITPPHPKPLITCLTSWGSSATCSTWPWAGTLILLITLAPASSAIFWRSSSLNQWSGCRCEPTRTSLRSASEKSCSAGLGHWLLSEALSRLAKDFLVWEGGCGGSLKASSAACCPRPDLFDFFGCWLCFFSSLWRSAGTRLSSFEVFPRPSLDFCFSAPMVICGPLSTRSALLLAGWLLFTAELRLLGVILGSGPLFLGCWGLLAWCCFTSFLLVAKLWPLFTTLDSSLEGLGAASLQGFEAPRRISEFTCWTAVFKWGSATANLGPRKRLAELRALDGRRSPLVGGKGRGRVSVITQRVRKRREAGQRRRSSHFWPQQVLDRNCQACKKEKKERKIAEKPKEPWLLYSTTTNGFKYSISDPLGFLRLHWNPVGRSYWSETPLRNHVGEKWTELHHPQCCGSATARARLQQRCVTFERLMEMWEDGAGTEMKRSHNVHEFTVGSWSRPALHFQPLPAESDSPCWDKDDCAAFIIQGCCICATRSRVSMAHRIVAKEPFKGAFFIRKWRQQHV